VGLPNKHENLQFADGLYNLSHLIKPGRKHDDEPAFANATLPHRKPFFNDPDKD
jgi:hypothetical protein